MKYDDMSLVDIIDDYGRVRGDLCEQYARDQLVSVLNRHVTRAVNEALNEAADEIEAAVLPGHPIAAYRDGTSYAASIVRARTT